MPAAHFSLMFMLFIIGSLCTTPTHAQNTDPSELMVYTAMVNQSDGVQTIRIYDSQTDDDPIITENAWSVNWYVYPFTLSIDGQVAYTVKEAEAVDIYITDTKNPQVPAVNITDTPERYERTYSWSPDGNYLAYISFEPDETESQFHLWDGENTISFPDFYTINPIWSVIGHSFAFVTNDHIYVWDGQNILDVTPGGALEVKDIVWSADGDLAFSVIQDEIANSPINNEIYIWRGEEALNLSQNPSSYDGWPSWSRDGRLAFLQISDENNTQIMVWDGVSFKDGFPDKNTITNIVIDVILDYSSQPYWLRDGRIMFSAGTSSTYSQIYVWDGQNTINLNKDIEAHLFGSIASNGYLAFSTYFSAEQVVFIKDSDGNEVFRMEGRGSPAWDADGSHLMFCGEGSSSSFKLMVWDGQPHTIIDEAGFIYAQWQSGESILCSHG